MKQFLLLLFFISLTTHAQTYQLSPDAELSVLTIGPGENLNDAFGHNAFRIQDRALGMDAVYGYGEYDFDTPNFYLKFAQGKLIYQMSKTAFSDFYNYYVYYNRTIEEQTLNLSFEEKQRLYEYLINNYKPENRKYLYDFFYDNCATRIRDVAVTAIEDEIDFNVPVDFETKTFRKLIHEHTGRNNWGSFGIDLALGSVIDKEATPYEHMYLPKYIHQFFGNAELDDSKKLVKSDRVLYQASVTEPSNSFLFSPLMVLGIMGLLILYITYTDYKHNKRSKWLDVSLFVITGLIGVVVLLLWFATDHTATANNYNLLWAFPFNLLFLGQLLKPEMKPWFRRYIKFLLIMGVLLTLHWIMGVQIYALGLIPFLIALFVRYMYLIHYSSKHLQTVVK